MKMPKREINITRETSQIIFLQPKKINTVIDVTLLSQISLRLVAPVVTPRFAPNCDQELLIGLGDITKKYESEGLRVQTHLSECLPEVTQQIVDPCHTNKILSIQFHLFQPVTMYKISSCSIFSRRST